MTTVTVVTPWADHLDLAQDYFDALTAANVDDLVIIDNGSDPELPFATIRNDTNLGFARACNQGLEAAETDAVLFLNNDIELIHHGWLERLRGLLEPGVLVGPLRYDPHGAVDGVALPYIDGWLIAGMRDDLLTLEGFDTTYNEPAYYADNDLCLRARARGMILRDFIGGLYHKENTTAGDQTSPRVAAVSRANRRLFETKARLILA